MAEPWLEWNSDFVASATGDLLLADGSDVERQRIVRRLLTAVRGYIFHLQYGAGLPQQIGRTPRVSVIRAIVKSQMLLERVVAQSPPPTVDVSPDLQDLGKHTISISYKSRRSGETVSLSLSV